MVPKELDVWGIYFPPLPLAGILGVSAMMITAYFLNRYRMSRFVVLPQVVFLAIAAIYTCLIGTFIFPS